MRRWLTITLIMLAVCGLILASIPWWLGPMLRPLGRARGITIGGYERIGYARFRLHDVQFTRPNVQVTAARVEADTPLLWLWRLAHGAVSIVNVQDWRVDVPKNIQRPAEISGEKIDGPPALYTKLRRIAAALSRWLPEGHIRHGVVHWPGGELAIDQAVWQQSRLAVRGLQAARYRLDVAVVPANIWTITAQSADAPGDWRMELVWSGADVNGRASVLAQPLSLTAHFAAHGWIPSDATAEAKDWNIPASRLRLGGPYGRLEGGGRLHWANGAFELAGQAKAVPQSSEKAPPLEVRAEAQGDRQTVTITALHVNAPFATAELTAPVTFGFDGTQRSGPARLTFRADFAKQTWIQARGQMRGAVVIPAATMGARQEFELEIDGLQWRDFAVQHIAAKGALQWPRLELTDFDLRLDPTNRVTGSGGIDLHTRELADVAVEAHLASDWFTRWPAWAQRGGLPFGLAWDAAELTAKLSGPLGAPRHTGSAKLTQVRVAALKPFNVTVAWTGEGAALGDFSARAMAGGSTLQLAGSVDLHRAILRELHFASGDVETWRLTQPATVGWQPTVRVDGVDLRGPSGNSLTVTAAGGDAAEFNLDASEVDPAAWRDWFALSGPAWRLERLHADGHVVAGKLVFATELSALIELKPQPAKVRLSATGDDKGVRLTELTVVAGNRVLTQAKGRLPIFWGMQNGYHLHVDNEAPMEFEANTEPDSPLWTTLFDKLGFVLTRPAAHFQIGGTLREPKGELRVDIARLEDTGAKFRAPLPNLEDFVLQLRVERGAVTLDSLTAKIEGQALHATGRLPMDDARWQQLWRAPAAVDWREIEAHVEIPDADLAMVARRLPNFPLAQGRLRVSAEQAGGKLSGEVRLVNATTRPVDPLGVVQEINGEFALTGRTVDVRSFTAKLGGEPVMLQGNVTLPAEGEPRLALVLQGKNLPFVRRAGLLVRSDLDLRADTDRVGTTRVTGIVNLRDCLVLADLSALLPTGQRGVTRQPPYFAVEAQPFNRWQLAVDVRGQESVRVRTTVFRGTASPRFHLSGTLGEPRVVGELTVNQGQVFFPFATFNVQLGVVRLSEADPYHPQLTLTALSNRQDYLLRLEATGSPDAPNITFSSNPPLEAGQVLLLVTTGQPPASNTSGTTGQQRLTRLGTYIGKGLFGGLSGGDEGRLDLVAGNQTSRQGRDTYEVDYRLDDRWSLVGEYDEFDDYNAGVKWRLYQDNGGSREKK